MGRMDKKKEKNHGQPPGPKTLHVMISFYMGIW